MKSKTIALGMFCSGVGLATWAGTNQLPTSTNSDVSISKSCPCSLQNDDLTKANQSDVSVLVWANEAAVSAYSYNNTNQETALKQFSSFFTKKA